MVNLAAAEAACEEEVTGKTREDQARAWRRFREWRDFVGLIDKYYLEKSQEVKEYVSLEHLP